MRFQGTKVHYKSPLGDEHTTYYQHGVQTCPKATIQKDVTRYGLKVHSINIAVIPVLTLRCNEDLVIV